MPDFTIVVLAPALAHWQQERESKKRKAEPIQLDQPHRTSCLIKQKPASQQSIYTGVKTVK